jgi:chromosomal replication initiator protein
LARLDGKIDTHSLETWILPAKPLEASDTRFTISAPSRFHATWVEAHYAGVLKDALKETTGTDYELSFIVAAADPPPFEAVAVPEPAAAQARRRSTDGTYLNPKYTFRSFVVGGSNKMTHAAALAVAERPARAYNPLFIYGGVGLGKTHIMQAVGNYVLDSSDDARVWYVSSENFMNEMIYSIQHGSTLAFRNKYRGVDVLLIDDIQFLAGKESTQEEFFHTFNTLYDAHKQIVVTSDRPPKQITDLEERLVSRFEWGLVTDMQPPDFETRVAILKKKAEEDRLAIPDDVFHMIADAIKSNIRVLEGSLVRLVAFSSIQGSPITADLAREALKDIFRPQVKTVSIDDIKAVVAKHFKIVPETLVGRKRTSAIALPRQVGMYLARVLTNMSLADIGTAFGKRDHTTVIHGFDKIAEKVKSDSEFKALVDRITEDIRQAA